MAGFDATLYSAGLIGPRPVWPYFSLLIWSAIAIRPAHCGQLSDVPPMSYRPLDRRKRDQAKTLAGWTNGRLAEVGGAAVSGRAEHGDAVGRRVLERVAQVLQRLEAPERILGRGEALRDHVGEVVLHYVVLG